MFSPTHLCILFINIFIELVDVSGGCAALLGDKRRRWWARLTVLLSVVGPVRTLVGIISGNTELQRRNAGKVFIV